MLARGGRIVSARATGETGMTIIKTVLMASAVALAPPALAAPIDGTWLVDMKATQYSAKPKMRTLAGGVYRCSSCVPAYAVPADGKFHAIKGNLYGTEIAVRPIDAKSVAYEYQTKGKPTGSDLGTVSADGKSMSWRSKSIEDNGTVVASESTDVRLAPAPKGSHAISGSWRTGKTNSIDAKALTVSFKDTGTMFHTSQPTGYSSVAPIGGKPVRVMGDTSGTMVSVRRAGPTTYVTTNWLKGKQMSSMTIHVVNATTISAVNEDKMSGRVTRYTATKQ